MDHVNKKVTEPLKDFRGHIDSGESDCSSLAALFVFAVNECDWVLARDAANAREVWMEMTGDYEPDEFSLFSESDLHPLTDEQLRKLIFREDDGKSLTFAEQIERMRRGYSCHKWEPSFFASTEW